MGRHDFLAILNEFVDFLQVVEKMEADRLPKILGHIKLPEGWNLGVIDV